MVNQAECVTWTLINMSYYTRVSLVHCLSFVILNIIIHKFIFVDNKMFFLNLFFLFQKLSPCWRIHRTFSREVTPCGDGRVLSPKLPPWKPKHSSEIRPSGTLLVTISSSSFMSCFDLHVVLYPKQDDIILLITKSPDWGNFVSVMFRDSLQNSIN